MTKIDLTLYGATGTVGQKFIQLLDNHPSFRIAALHASPRSAGKKYKDACRWNIDGFMPPYVKDMIIRDCSAAPETRLVLSALDASVAGDVENRLRTAGHIVVSNAKNHRMDNNVPIIIPEINISHLHSSDQGLIVTNPNCSTAGIALALAPIHERFDITQINVVTMQAVSGAGYPGTPAMDIMGNVIPYINGEEEKIETELVKILGQNTVSGFRQANMSVSASCNRVPVRNGHMLDISFSLRSKTSASEIIEAWDTFRGDPLVTGLHSAPAFPVQYLTEPDMPSPSILNDKNGMTVYTGRLRKCPALDYRFTALVHNTIRGAAGNAVLIAEFMNASNMLS